MKRAMLWVFAMVCVGSLTLGCGDDEDDEQCEEECDDDYEKCIEGVQDDPETGLPYNWNDYCADGYVSDAPDEIQFCDCTWNHRNCMDDC